MYILTIYCIDSDIEIKMQQASADVCELKRAALKWAIPYGLVEPDTTAGIGIDEGCSYIMSLSPDRVDTLFQELCSYLNDGAGADDPRIVLRKADWS